MKKKLFLLIILVALSLLVLVKPAYATLSNGYVFFPEYTNLEALESQLGFAPSSQYSISNRPNTGSLVGTVSSQTTIIGINETTYYRDFNMGWTTLSVGLNLIVIDVGFKVPLTDMRANYVTTSHPDNQVRVLTYRSMSDSSFPYHYLIMLHAPSVTGWSNGGSAFRFYYDIDTPTAMMSTPSFYRAGSLASVSNDYLRLWSRSYSTLQYDRNSDIYNLGYMDGQRSATGEGYNRGYDEGRLEFGKYVASTDTWYTAIEWGDIRFNEGQEFEWLGYIVSALSLPMRVAAIEVLPGVQIGYFALFSLLIGMLGWFFFLVGKGGKK